MTAPSQVPTVAGVLHGLAAEHHVPGAQLALYDRGERSNVEYGELAYNTGQAVTGGSCFPVGSISKLFTATLAMILVADGDLDLDEPVRGHLDPGERGQLDPALTLRHLLSHTGGLPSGPNPADVRATSLRRYVQDYARVELAGPGALFSYSNVGYVLTGRLIEVVTGMGWQEAVESILLAPLGIRARFLPEQRPAGGPPLASGHSVNPAVGRTRTVRQSLIAAEAPAGALSVSARDLLALGLLHLRPGKPGLLPPAQAAAMRAPLAGADPYGLAAGWGLGLAVYPGGVVGHDGNACGTSCYLRLSADGEWALALTTNANAGAALWPELLDSLAAQGIGTGRALVGGTVVRTDPGPRPAVGEYAACAGRYLNGDVEYVVVDADGGLWLSVDGDPFARVALHPGLTFDLIDPDTGHAVPGGRFLRDGAGRADAVGWVQLGGRLARHSGQPATADVRRLIA